MSRIFSRGIFSGKQEEEPEEPQPKNGSAPTEGEGGSYPRTSFPSTDPENPLYSAINPASVCLIGKSTRAPAAKPNPDAVEIGIAL